MGIDKERILICNTSFNDQQHQMKYIVKELNKKKVKFKVYFDKYLIITNNLIIKFVVHTHFRHYSGNITRLRADGCYGFSEDEANNITNANNICKGLNLMDYIYKKENINV